MAMLNYEDVRELIDNVCDAHRVTDNAVHQHLQGSLASLNELMIVADGLAVSQQELEDSKKLTEDIVYAECYRHFDISEKDLSFDTWLDCKTTCSGLYDTPYTKEDIMNILKCDERVNKDYERYLGSDTDE